MVDRRNAVQIENPLNESSLAFPVLGSIHLLGIVCALGAVALMNFRLLGIVKTCSPAQLWRGTLPLVLGGLAIAIASGLLLFTIALQEYAQSQVFQFKMAVLVAAVVFYFTVVRYAAKRDRTASAVAAVSLVLYSLIPLGGILLGYE